MKFFIKLICFGLCLTITPALAAQEGPIALSGEVHAVVEIVADDGTTHVELETPGTIVPGDRLLFSTSYANTSTETVENFVVTNPLPAAVRLAPEVESGVIVSVDNGNTWGRLSELSVKSEDGSSRPAQHSDVTHIRWTLDRVEPGQSGRLEYLAIIR